MRTTEKMSTKKDSKPYLLEVYRRNNTRVLNDIRRGMVNEDDMDKLQNFVQTGLALMAMVDVKTFRQAQRNAEIAGFLHAEDHEVILDPKKQPPLESKIDLDMEAIVKQAQQEMDDV